MEVWPPLQSWVRLWTLHLSVTKTLFHIDTPLFLYWVCGLATAGCRNINSELQVGQVGLRRFWCVSLGFLTCSFRVHRLCQGTTPLVHHTVQNLDRHYSFMIRCFSGVCCPGGDTRCWKYVIIFLQQKIGYQAFCKSVGSVWWHFVCPCVSLKY